MVPGAPGGYLSLSHEHECGSSDHRCAAPEGGTILRVGDNSEEFEMETPEAPRNSDRDSIPRTITPLSGVPAVSRMATLRFPLLQTQIEQVVNDALNEDGAYDDITTIATIA